MKIVRMDKEIFEHAFALVNQELGEARIFSALQENDDTEKQIAILQIKDLKNDEQTEQLVNHLTGQDGPIREATAIKLRELVLDKKCHLLDNLCYYKTYADAVCDVNPNICRAVIDFLPKLNNRTELLRIIEEKVENIFHRIKAPDIEQKNFLTVRLFNLYWCLEALSELLSDNFDDENETLNHILSKSSKFNDYTINEKIAKILTYSPKIKDFDKIKSEISSSNNFYVKRYLGE